MSGLNITKIEIYKKGDYFGGITYDITSSYSAQLSKIKITKELNEADLLDIGLINLSISIDIDDYIIIWRGGDSVFFGGFVTTKPEWQFLGADGSTTGAWGFIIRATSHSYLFNTKGIPINISPYANKTHKDILIDLANKIIPYGIITDMEPDGFKGALETFYIPNPSKKWSEIATEFAETDNARWWFEGAGNFYYTPLIPDDGTYRNASGEYVPVDSSNASQHDYKDYIYLTDYVENPHYDHKLFTHANFKLNQLEQDYKNDVIVIGDDCPSYPINEEHIADGVTGTFKLKEVPYGTAEVSILEEAWSSSSFDTTKWTVTNQVGCDDEFTLEDGVLIVDGTGTTTVSGNYIRTNAAIEMAGEILIRAGEIEFLSFVDGGEGFISALYPLSTPSVCAYGFYITTLNSNTRFISACINDVTNLGTTYALETGKAYIPRIHISVDEPQRILQQSYQEYETIDPSVYTNGRIKFELEVYDINNPEEVVYEVLYTADIVNIPTALWFYPIVHKLLNVTICNTEVTKPIQIEAFRTSSVEKDSNGNFVKWPIKIGSSLDGADANLQVTDNACDLVFYDTKSDGKTSNTPKQGEKISLRYWGIAKAQYHVRDVWGVQYKRACDTRVGLSTTDPDNLLGYVVTTSGSTSSILKFQESNVLDRPRDYFATYLATWNIGGTFITVTIVNSENTQLWVVTSEEDGLIPTALIPTSGITVTLFKSVYKVFDDGVRSVVVTDLSPSPKCDREAEIMAKAYLWDHTQIKWEGSYTGILGDIIKDVPMVGARVLIEVKHFDSLPPDIRDNNPSKNINNKYYIMARLQGVTLEEFGGVYNTESKQVEAVVQYTMSFKTGEKLNRFLKKLLLNRRGVITGGNLSLLKEYNPYTQEYNDLADVVSVKVKSVTPTTLNLQIDNTYEDTQKYIEIRKTNDVNWGFDTENLVTDTGNIALSTTSATSLSLLRSTVGKRAALYFRVTTGSTPSITNQYSRHSSLLYVDYPKVPPAVAKTETVLNERITFNLTLPSSVNTAIGTTHFADGVDRSYYTNDIVGVEIRDKFRNLLFKGMPPINITQAPAYASIPWSVYAQDYLYKHTFIAADVLDFDTILPETIGGEETGNFYQELTLSFPSGPPTDMNGRVWHLDQFRGYRIHIEWASGITHHTILGNTVYDSGPKTVTLKIETEENTYISDSDVETGKTFYITVCDEYTAKINANNVLEISWPRNLDIREYNDFYVNTYNALGEVDYYNPIASITTSGGYVALVFTDPLCATTLLADDFNSIYKKENDTIIRNHYFNITDYIALIPATLTGNSTVVHTQIKGVDFNTNTITIDSLAENVLGFTDLVGGYIRKLVNITNEAPLLIETGSPATYIHIESKQSAGIDTKPENESIWWEGKNATHYHLTISSASARAIHINHPGEESEQKKVVYGDLTSEERTSNIRVEVIPHDNFGEGDTKEKEDTTGDTEVPDAPVVTVDHTNLVIHIYVGPPDPPDHWKGVTLLELDLCSLEDFSEDVSSIQFSNVKSFKKDITVVKDGKYYYRARAKNNEGYSEYTTGNITVHYGTDTGDYEDDWFGVFLAPEGIVGRKNTTGEGTRNPPVFLLAANDFDGMTEDTPPVEDPVLPAWKSGDVVFADDVKTAMEDPDNSDSYFKLFTSTNGTVYLSLKAPVINKGSITAASFVTSGRPDNPHVVINDLGIAGWKGTEPTDYEDVDDPNWSNLSFAIATDDTLIGKIDTKHWHLAAGEIWAKAGVIGGWSLNNHVLSSWSGNTGEEDITYVALNSNASATSSIIMWCGNRIAANAPFRLQCNGNFFVGNAETGNYLEWTGTELNIAGNLNVTVGGTIGGWQILEIQQGTDIPQGWKKRLESGSTAGTYVALDSGTTDTGDPYNPSGTYAIWLGEYVAANAPFRIKRDGSFHAGTASKYVEWNGTNLVVNGVVLGGTNTIPSDGAGAVLIGDVAAGHTRINKTGIAGWSGAEPSNIEDPTDPNWRNLKYALATTSWTIGKGGGSDSWTMAAGDIWGRGGVIGGWTLKEQLAGTIPNTYVIKRLESGDAGTYVALDSGTTKTAAQGETYNPYDPAHPENSYVIWAGANIASSAKFRVQRSGRFHVGDTTHYLEWDGSALNIYGAINSITGGTIAGWNITQYAIRAVYDGKYMGLQSGNYTSPDSPYTFYSGATDYLGTGALFYVTSTGSVVAKQGSIGGWDLSATTFSDVVSGPKIMLNSSIPYIAIGPGGTTPASAITPTTPTTGTGIYIDPTGFFANYGSVQKFKFETATGNLTLAGKIYVTSPTDAGLIMGSGAHITINPTGIAFWNASEEIPSNLNVCISNTWTGEVTVNNQTFTIGAGDLFARNGHFTGTVQATGGFIGSGIGALPIDNSGFTISTTGRIASAGATAYNAGIGFWLGYDTSTYKFRIGDPADKKLTWDGSELYIKGRLSIEGTTGTPSLINGTLSIINGSLIAGALDSGHVVMNTAGIAGWKGVETTVDNISFALFTTAGSTTIGTPPNTYTIDHIAGDVMLRRGWIGGDDSGYTIEISPSFIQSSEYAAGSKGFRIQCDGKAYFNELEITVPADITSGTIGGIHIDGTSIHSALYVTNSAGFIIRSDGTAEFQQVKIRSSGTLNSSTSNLVYAGDMSGASYINDWYGVFIASEGIVGRKKVDGESTKNPAVFLIAASNFVGDTVLPSFSAGDFCVADDVALAMGEDPLNDSAWFIKANSTGVAVKGAIYGLTGTIGGWSLYEVNQHAGIKKRLESGSGNNHVAFDSGTTDAIDDDNPLGTYAIWAGGQTAASAKFNVSREGVVNLSGTLTLKAVAGSSIFRMYGNTGYIDLEAAGTIDSYSLTFPTSSSNGYLKNTGGSLSWESGGVGVHDFLGTDHTYNNAFPGFLYSAPYGSGITFRAITTSDLPGNVLLEGDPLYAEYLTGTVSVAHGGTGDNLTGSSGNLIYKVSSVAMGVVPNPNSFAILTNAYTLGANYPTWISIGAGNYKVLYSTGSTIGVVATPSTTDTYLKYTNASGLHWASGTGGLTMSGGSSADAAITRLDANTLGVVNRIQMPITSGWALLSTGGGASDNTQFRLGWLTSGTNIVNIEFYTNGPSLRTAWIGHDLGDTSNFLVKKQGNLGYLILGTGNSTTEGTVYINNVGVGIGAYPDASYSLKLGGSLYVTNNIVAAGFLSTSSYVYATGNITSATGYIIGNLRDSNILNRSSWPQAAEGSNGDIILYYWLTEYKLFVKINGVWHYASLV